MTNDIPSGYSEKYCHDHAELKPCYKCEEIDRLMDGPSGTHEQLSDKDIDQSDLERTK